MVSVSLSVNVKTSNYRPIAMTVVFSKIREHIGLSRMTDYLG